MVLGVGNIGIHACNGANVERIDNKIPDLVFDIKNEFSGVNRVHGIRDFLVEMVYWCLPNLQQTAANPFPDRILVYNYVNGSWAINNDSITCFGYFQPTVGITWDNPGITWDDVSVKWDAGEYQAQFRSVVAGNQEGFVFIVDANASYNASVLSITNVEVVAGVVQLTIQNHNIAVSEFIELSLLTGITRADNVTPFEPTNVKVALVIDENTIQILKILRLCQQRRY